MVRETLREAFRRSRTLDERLAVVRPRERASPAALARFDRWARYLADRDALLRRLSWDGVDARTALAALEDDAAAGGTFPFLEEAIAGLSPDPYARFAELRALATEPLPPFAVFAAALVQPVAGRLAPRLRDARFSDTAAAQLELAAVRAIASLLQYVLHERFAGARRYDELTSRLLRPEEATELFAGLAAAARGVDLFLAQYETNTTELLSRLADDREDLERLFGGGLGDVAAVAAGKSDRHDGGRQVALLEFSCGRTLVYKPRAVTLFAAFHGLVEWCRARGLDCAPPSLRVLPRAAWGWIELAAPAAPHDPGRYFTRAGALLFLAWLVSARDLHMENVIATAEGPVLIDLDAVAVPEERSVVRGTFDRARDRIARSTLATGLLTFSHVDPEGRVYEAGGLCGTGGHLSAADAPVWRGDGTDALRLERERRYGARGANVVVVDGAVVRAEEHAEEIVRGFREAYDFARVHGHALRPELAKFGRGATRVVFRPSSMYAAIHARLITPPFLRDGLEPSLVAETLNRAFVNERRTPRLWPLARDERRDLLAWDVPLFHAATDSVDLVSREGEVVRGWFARSGLDVMSDRLDSLGEADRELQCELIASALIAPSFTMTDDRPLPGSDPLPPERAVEVALALADVVWSRAVRGEDGATWIGSRQLRMDERTDRGVSYYLYDGGPGIALFFGALHAVTGDDTHRRRAEACVRPLDAVLGSAHAETLLRGEGIGGANGLGSIVIALARLHRLTGDSRHLERALAAARFLSGERIARDTRLDVEGGAAGALAALLLLFEGTGDAGVLRGADAAARRLAAAVVEMTTGVAWPSPGGMPLAGYAHGAAGIAAALARFSATTGDQRSAGLARRALAFERSVFDRRRRNWPVLEHDPPVFMSAWCHGAAGGVLARLAMRDAVGDADLDDDLGPAIEQLLAGGAAAVDHLCCGTMGRVDALLTAGHHAAARSLAAAVADQARSAGAFALLAPPHHRVFEAGLFRGLSGIGYELLRVAHPDEVPSVLTFGGRA